MELLASVSRSGGDGAEGDALKDPATQARFREYIDTRIRKYHSARREAADEQEILRSIVRLFRKLREGVVASHRLDSFAIEVFEDSVRYAVLARDVPQLNAALNGLVPDLYRAVDGATSGQQHPQALFQDQRTHFASLLLLYHLVHSSRAVYQSTLEDLTLPPRPLRVAAPLMERSLSGDMASLSLHATQQTRTVKPPTTAFVAPHALRFAREAARVLAPETFDPLAFAALVAGGAEPGGAEGLEALERALLAWAGPAVRERAGALLRKAYVSASTSWAATLLAVSEDGVDMWAMGQGLRVHDGVVKLR